MGIVQWKLSSINNGILEGLNSIIQAAKRKARGYGKKHFKTHFNIVAYLLAGKLDLHKINANLPTCSNKNLIFYINVIFSGNIVMI